LNFIGIFVVAGVIWALVRSRGPDILLLGFPFLHFLFFTAKTKGSPVPHYLMPALPFFLLLGGVFCVEIVKWMFRNKTSIVLSGVKVGIALLFCLPVSLLIINHNLRNETNTSNLARKWVEANIPAGSRILYADYHDLQLKPDVQSVTEDYKWCRANGISQEVPKEKLEAIKNYAGPTYYIEYLYRGWNDEARESVRKVDYLPQGVSPFQHERFSLQFWHDRKFQYAIVFRDAVNRYLTGEEGGRFPALRKFYIELLENSTLIQEFKADPPKIIGSHIQILELNHEESSNDGQDGTFMKNSYPAVSPSATNEDGG
jgi:hypothetical protein